MRVLLMGGLAASLVLALSVCSGVEVIEDHQLKHEDVIQYSPLPALRQEMENVIDAPPATLIGISQNMPNAPPGVSIQFGSTVLPTNHARVVGIRLHGTLPV